MFIKKVSSNKLPTNPLFPFIVSQNVSVWNTVKNNAPEIEYKTMKNKLSIMYKIFLSIITDRDIKNSEIGINNEVKPIDWYKISEVKLPFEPSKFFISALSGKIKFGSSGE